MTQFHSINLRHAVFAALEVRAKKEGKNKNVLCSELLKKALDGIVGRNMTLFEPSKIYTNHGRLVNNIDPTVHMKLKELAIETKSTMMDIASSLLMVELGLSADEISNQQGQPLEPREWVVTTRRGAASLKAL